MNLSEKEKLFSLRYVSTGNPVNSLKFAGYTKKLCTPKKAISLLEKKHIKKKIQELREEQRKKLKSTVICGLKKLAFGSINNQVKILMSKNFENQNSPSHDLFNVQEIRIPRSGALEIKFFNRQSAMEKLLEFIRDESCDDNYASDSLSDIFNALKHS